MGCLLLFLGSTTFPLVFCMFSTIFRVSSPFPHIFSAIFTKFRICCITIPFMFSSVFTNMFQISGTIFMCIRNRVIAFSGLTFPVIHGNRVFVVFFWSYSSKIGNSIIGFISVNMVYIRLILWVRNKGLSDQAMDIV